MGFDPPDGPAGASFAAPRGLGPLPPLRGPDRGGKARRRRGRVRAAVRSGAGGRAAARPDRQRRLRAAGGSRRASSSTPGFLDEEERRAAYAEALALVNPSHMESLSIVLMEAWLEGTPALVAPGSDVLREHAERSGGGLVFDSYESYRDAVDRPARRAGASRAARRGRARVRPRRSTAGRPCGDRFREDCRAARGVIAVHQLLPAAAPGDAVTDQAFAWRDLLARLGPSRRDRRRARASRPARTRCTASTVRASDSSARARSSSATRSGARRPSRALRERERSALVYHNITPGELLRDFNPSLADLCDRGAKALGRLPRRRQR